ASIETDHKHHDQQYQAFTEILDSIISNKNPEERLAQGYDFYLAFRLFSSENLQHLHHEETVIMPELQRLLTDAELKTVEHHTYAIMTPEQMTHMMQVL